MTERLVPTVLRHDRAIGKLRTQQLESIVYGSALPGKSDLVTHELAHQLEKGIGMNFQDAFMRMLNGGPGSFRARRKVWDPQYFVHLNDDGRAVLVNEDTGGTRGFGTNIPNLAEDASDITETDWVFYPKEGDTVGATKPAMGAGDKDPGDTPDLPSASRIERVEHVALTALPGVCAIGSSLKPPELIGFTFRLAEAFVAEADLRRGNR